MKKKSMLSVVLLLAGTLLFAQADLQMVYKKIDTTILKLAVYYPAGYNASGHYPAIIFFFGGGWNNGTADQFAPQAQYFAKRGMICFLADYRVKTRQQVSPFECVKDAKSAIRFVRSHARELHLDPDRIVASGGSAGGHLAAAAALTTRYNDDQDDLAISCIPNALVLFNPVIDNGPGGYAFEKIGKDYPDFSPIHNIKKGAPPTLFLLGTKDHLIPVATAENYKRLMDSVGSRCELKLYEGEEHGFFNARKPENFRKTVAETDEFLQSLGYLTKPLALKAE